MGIELSAQNRGFGFQDDGGDAGSEDRIKLATSPSDRSCSRLAGRTEVSLHGLSKAVEASNALLLLCLVHVGLQSCGLVVLVGYGRGGQAIPGVLL